MFYHGNKRYVEPERLEQYQNLYKAEAKREIDENEQEKQAQLLNMFKIISSFALPNPGESVASKSSSGKISEISDRFRRIVGYCIESIIDNIEPLQVKEDTVQAKNFSSY